MVGLIAQVFFREGNERASAAACYRPAAASRESAIERRESLGLRGPLRRHDRARLPSSWRVAVLTCGTRPPRGAATGQDARDDLGLVSSPTLCSVFLRRRWRRSSLRASRRPWGKPLPQRKIARLLSPSRTMDLSLARYRGMRTRHVLRRAQRGRDQSGLRRYLGSGRGGAVFSGAAAPSAGGVVHRGPVRELPHEPLDKGGPDEGTITFWVKPPRLADLPTRARAAFPLRTRWHHYRDRKELGSHNHGDPEQNSRRPFHSPGAPPAVASLGLHVRITWNAEP